MAANTTFLTHATRSSGSEILSQLERFPDRIAESYAKESSQRPRTPESEIFEQSETSDFLWAKAAYELSMQRSRSSASPLMRSQRFGSAPLTASEYASESAVSSSSFVGHSLLAISLTWGTGAFFPLPKNAKTKDTTTKTAKRVHQRVTIDPFEELGVAGMSVGI